MRVREWAPRGLAGPPVLAALFALVLAGCGDEDRNQRLAVLDLESGETRIVSDDDRTVSTAQWLPDSQRILVLEGETPGGYFLSLRDIWSGDAVWEVEGTMEDRQPLAMAPSPDGSQVAVLRDTFAGAHRRAQIEFVSAADGSVVRATDEWVTTQRLGVAPIAASVSWAASGQIALVSHHGDGLNDLARLDPPQSDLRWETTQESEVWVLMNAQGTRAITFGMGQPGPSRLLLYEGDNAARELPIPFLGNFFAAFAPDGERLAVASAEKVFIYDCRDGLLHEIASARTQGISWGGNGRIAMAWGNEVFSIAEDGTDRQTLAKVGGGKSVRHPVWSPDGRKLAYVVEPKYRD